LFISFEKRTIRKWASQQGDAAANEWLGRVWRVLYIGKSIPGYKYAKAGGPMTASFLIPFRNAEPLRETNRQGNARPPGFLSV